MNALFTAMLQDGALQRLRNYTQGEPAEALVYGLGGSQKHAAVAACYAAVGAISEAIGTLPLHLYRRDGDDRTKASDHPLHAVLHRIACEIAVRAVELGPSEGGDARETHRRRRDRAGQGRRPGWRSHP